MKYSWLAFILLVPQAMAVQWFVEATNSTVTHDGHAWNTAWNSISQISGVAAGDTVWISGGLSGLSQTYAISNWSPILGTQSSRIIYQIAQDSGHNGTAIFSGLGRFFATGPSNIVFLGQVTNDTSCHFYLTNYTTIIGGGTFYPLNNLRLGYWSFTGKLTGNGIWGNFGHNVEIDYYYINVSGASGGAGNDVAFQFGNMDSGSFGAGAYIHNGTAILPRATGNNNLGYDFIQCNGGVSCVSNYVSGNEGAYASSQHQDGYQILGGARGYIASCVFSNLGNSGVYLDAVTAISSTWVINNLFIIPGAPATTNVSGIDAQCDGGPTVNAFDGCVVANNTLKTPAIFSINFIGLNQGSTFSAGNLMIANNITTVGSGPSHFGISGGNATVVNNPTGVATNNFVSTISGNYYLQSSASTLISSGTNLSSLFTTDFESKMRQSLPSMWDIGAYLFSTNSTIPPTITTSTCNPLFWTSK